MPEAWSPSRSRTWRTCRRQFLLRDVLHAAPSQPEPVTRIRGRLVHSGLEAVFRAVAVNTQPRRALLDYSQLAYTAMADHPDAARLSPAARDAGRDNVHRTLAALPAPNPAAILGVETPFSLPREQGAINGRIDLMLRTGASSVHVRDWKDGKPDEDAQLLEFNIALGVYTEATQRIFPWAREITVGLYFTQVQREMTRRLDPGSVTVLVASVERDSRTASDAVAALKEPTTDILFPPRAGEHCGRCDFRSLCPIFANADLPVRPGVDVAAERLRLGGYWSTSTGERYRPL